MPVFAFCKRILLCMILHDRLEDRFSSGPPELTGFSYFMQVHENHYMKRAGVAGIRARATGVKW